jgi:hypothetical protein
MFTKKTKRYLMLLSAVGLLAIAAGGAGTFASFDAEVTNSGNTFTSGTLFLHDTPNGGTTCTSESDTTNNRGSDTCTVLFNANLQNGTAIGTIALNNAGTINASDIEFKVASCGVTDNHLVTLSTVTFGTAPTCSDMWVTIQETGATYVVPGSDVYCAFGVTTTPPDCDAPSATNSLGSATAFATLKTTANATATLNAAATRYYVIKITPNASSGNALQNRKVTFALTWHIDQ